jgi:hypothetical protein
MRIDSARELAYGLNNRLKLGLSPRPWNLYSPSDTFWWLVPSTEWPAYRYGKLAFSLGKDTPRKDLIGFDDSQLDIDHLFAGFNVEKGYSEVATFVNPALKRKTVQLVDDSWLWCELTGDDGAARFGRTLSTAATAADLRLYVVSSYVHDREMELHAPHDAVMFRCGRQGIQPALHNRFPVGVLRGIEKLSTFLDLARALRVIDGYHWVDIYVGTHVPKGEIDLLAFHSKTLSHFDAWLR